MSALQLKERIAMESRKLTESQRPSQLSGESTHSPSPPRTHAVSAKGHAPRLTSTHPPSVPGVHSIHQHALQTERARREAEAALKIQAAYRGFQVRRSLRWQLPLGGTLGGGRAGDGAEAESDNVGGGGSEEEEEVEEVIELDPVTIGQISSEPHGVTSDKSSFSGSQSCPLLPASASVPPWERPGGDAHSVINVYARQHERLRERLAELRNQKLVELQRIKEQTSSSRPLSAEGPELSVAGSREQGTLSLSYSYTQTFEEPSHEEDEEEEEEEEGGGGDDGGSQASEQFSHDSLVPTTSHFTTSRTLPVTVATPTETGNQSTKGPSVITPPGSPSFVDTYSDHTSLQLPEPKSEQPCPPAPRPPPPRDGRLSPRSLEVKLQAELNLLESVEESMRQLSALENTRAVSLVQQETVSLAQALKTRQQSHEREMDLLASKAKKEVEEASSQFRRVHDEAVLASEQVRKLREEADAQAREQARRLARLQEESAAAAQEATRQLVEARTSATSAVIGAAQQQIQAAHDMAVSAASAAARQAVKAALKGDIRAGVTDSSESAEYTLTPHDTSDRTAHEDVSHLHPTVPTYTSDFEPSTIQPDSLAEEEEKSVSSGLEGQRTPLPANTGEMSSSIEESLTPVASDVSLLVGVATVGRSRPFCSPQQVHLSAEGDGTLTEEEGERESGSPPPHITPSPEEELEESIDEEVSLLFTIGIGLHDKSAVVSK